LIIRSPHIGAGFVAPVPLQSAAMQKERKRQMEKPQEPVQHHAMPTMKYTTFAQMIVAGTIIMFGLMYLNTYSVDHIFFSETRAFMALIMGATMAIVMLAFMWKMYPSKEANIGIVVGSVAVFALALWLVRSQATVGDVAYMKAMIPHHSIAIMTSERATITDPRVRKLADGIIAAQKKEIGEMKDYIRDLETKK
jgi:uncharacterized protein (DUF305 family)